jgi:hypothetical protein
MNENANAVVARFRELQLDTNEPKWSSWVLNRFFEKTLSDGSLRDVYEGLNTALKVYAVKLTTTVATLIKEVVVQGFTQHRSTYDSMTWSWANSELSNGASAAQCYLFLLALPSEAKERHTSKRRRTRYRMTWRSRKFSGSYLPSDIWEERRETRAVF